MASILSVGLRIIACTYGSSRLGKSSRNWKAIRMVWSQWRATPVRTWLLQGLLEMIRVSRYGGRRKIDGYGFLYPAKNEGSCWWIPGLSVYLFMFDIVQMLLARWRVATFSFFWKLLLWFSWLGQWCILINNHRIEFFFFIRRVW